jgi:hypothetical protein
LFVLAIAILANVYEPFLNFAFARFSHNMPHKTNGVSNGSIKYQVDTSVNIGESALAIGKKWYEVLGARLVNSILYVMKVSVLFGELFAAYLLI